MLWKPAVENKLEADIMEGHDLMKISIAEESTKVGEPPAEHAPGSAMVPVHADAEALILLLEVEIPDKIELLHVLPPCRQSKTDDHGTENDSGIEDSE